MCVSIRGSTLNIGSYHGCTQKDSDSQSCHSTLSVIFSSFWARNLDAAAETETSLALVLAAADNGLKNLCRATNGALKSCLIKEDMFRALV